MSHDKNLFCRIPNGNLVEGYCEEGEEYREKNRLVDLILAIFFEKQNFILICREILENSRQTDRLNEERLHSSAIINSKSDDKLYNTEIIGTSESEMDSQYDLLKENVSRLLDI